MKQVEKPYCTELYNNPNKIDWERPVIIDFESYYDKTWSLSKITTENYIRGENWECIGVSIKVGAGQTNFYPRETGIPIIAELVKRLPNSPFVSHNCLTGDHEVRTENGWVRLDELRGGERVLQWQPKTGLAEFVEYEPFSKYYVGELYEYDTIYHKGIYTADHRIYYQTPTRKDWYVATAERIAKKHPNNIYLPTGFIVETSDKGLFDEKEILLLEVIRADGFRVNAETVKFNTSQPYKLERLKTLANLLGLGIIIIIIKRSEHRPDRPIYYEVRLKGSLIQHIYAVLGPTKKLNAWILDLPLNVRRAWLSEIWSWGGSKNSKYCQAIATKNKDTAYWLAELALFSGYMAHVSQYSSNKGGSKTEDVKYVVTIRDKHRIKFRTKPKTYTYSGKVYCISVPSNAFVVRRKGKVWVTGNCAFDMGILGLRYNIHPNFIADTIVMARMCGFDRVAGGKSLAKLSDQMEKMGLVTKIKGTTVHNMLGVHADDMSNQQWQEYADYCKLDTELCYALYKYCLPLVPVAEMLLSSVTTKMFTKPMFDLDVPLLEAYAVRLEKEKHEKLSRIAGDLGFADTAELHKHLRSSPKFVALLERFGVEVPMKLSEKTQKLIPAVSKTDKAFLDLLQHENELVVSLVETKLGTMSSMEQTRTATFLGIASRGLMPIPLTYGGAHTYRMAASSGSSLNVQNLAKRTKEPVLRRSMRAKKDHIVIATDSSGVEMRLNAFICGQQDLIDTFLTGKDPYVDMATVIYDKPYDEIFLLAKGDKLKGIEPTKEGKTMRNVGKQANLSCGYGMSDKTFRSRMELEGNKEAAEMAEQIVLAYRTKNHMITGFWKVCDRVLATMYVGGSVWFGGPNHNLFFADGSSMFHGVKIPSVRLPNGTYLFYQNLRKERGDDGRLNYVYDHFKGRSWETKRIWGSHFSENLCQSLAFCVLKWQALEIVKAGVAIHNNVHDEWVSVVPRAQAAEAVAVHYKAMKSTPDYITAGLLDCEVDVGLNFADLKTIDVGKLL